MKATVIIVRKVLELYFDYKVGDQDKVWAAKIFCNSCSRTVAGWLKGTHKSMPFPVPMVWHELSNQNKIFGWTVLQRPPYDPKRVHSLSFMMCKFNYSGVNIY
jgi:hypothetical protein